MLKKLFRQNETYLFLLIILLSILIGTRNPLFFTFENIAGFLKSYSMIGIMSVGTLFVLILGGTDVSFTAIAQVVEYAVVVLVMKFGGNIFIAFLEAAIIGTALGLLNGLIIYRFKVPIIIVTIATFNIYFGMLYVITKGKLINNIPQIFKDFGNILLFPQTSAIGGTYGLSLMPLIWLAALLLGWFILKKTMMGRSIFAVGGNEVAAERIGINTFATKLFVFGFVGFLAGIAGVVHVAIVQSVVPNIIVGKELEVIAAVVIGGASIFGGRGTIFGTFLGVLLFAMLNNGLTLLRISSYWYSVTIGAIIIIAIIASAYQRLQRAKANIKVQIQD